MEYLGQTLGDVEMQAEGSSQTSSNKSISIQSKYFFNLASKESRKSGTKDVIEVVVADELGNHQIITINFAAELKNHTEGGFLTRRLEVKNSTVSDLVTLVRPVNSEAFTTMYVTSYFGGSLKFLTGDSFGNIHQYDGSTLKRSAKVSDLPILSLVMPPGGIVYFASKFGIDTAQKSYGTLKVETTGATIECTPYMDENRDEGLQEVLVGGQPQHLAFVSNRDVYLLATHTLSRGCNSSIDIADC